MTLISQFASQMTIPPPELLLELLLLELLLLELLEVLLELLLLELVLLELLVELLLELPDAIVVPAITVGTVGMPLVGLRDALTAMLLPSRLSRSAAVSAPSPSTSIGVLPRRPPVIGSRSKMNPDPPSSQAMADGMSVAKTSLPVDRNG